MKKNIKVKNAFICSDCGADCHGVSGLIKGTIYCMKHYRQRLGIDGERTMPLGADSYMLPDGVKS